jgi:hypothetical protein
MSCIEFGDEAAERAYEDEHDDWMAAMRCSVCDTPGGIRGAEYGGVTTDEHDDDTLRALVHPEFREQPGYVWTDHLVCDECLTDLEVDPS